MVVRTAAALPVLETRPETPCREEGFSRRGKVRVISEPGIGGGVDDTGNQGAAGPPAAVSPVVPAFGHQGHGHRGGQVQLECGRSSGTGGFPVGQPPAALPILSAVAGLLQLSLVQYSVGPGGSLRPSTGKFDPFGRCAPYRNYRPGNLPRRTGQEPPSRSIRKSSLGVRPVRAARHPGNQSAARSAKGPPSP